MRARTASGSGDTSGHCSRRRIASDTTPDGFGKRYIVGPLYLLLDDLEGALTSFRWFQSEFPDDCGEPGQYLCWTLALHRSAQEDEAISKLRQTALLNLYVVPHLLNEPACDLGIWLGSSHAWPEYVQQIPPEYFQLWEDTEREWARSIYTSPGFRKVVNRWIEIHVELKNLAPGVKRSALVDEASSLRG